MKVKTSLFALIFAIAVPGIATAGPEFEGFEREHKMRQFHQHQAMHGGWKKLRRAFAKLDLSDEQKQSLESLKQNNKETWKSAHKKMRELKHQMRELMDADQVDENAIRNLTSQMASQRADQILFGLQVRDQALAVLTSEQKSKLTEMRAKHKAKRQAIKEILEE